MSGNKIPMPEVHSLIIAQSLPSDNFPPQIQEHMLCQDTDFEAYKVLGELSGIQIDDLHPTNCLDSVF